MGTAFFFRSRRSTDSSSANSSSPSADASSTSSASTAAPGTLRRADDRYAVRMPMDNRAESVEEAVQALQKCSPDDLRRARRHHRRALEALQDGCYDALGDDTRGTLIQRLKADLTALNRALGAAASGAMNAASEMDGRMSVSY